MKKAIVTMGLAFAVLAAQPVLAAEKPKDAPKKEAAAQPAAALSKRKKGRQSVKTDGLEFAAILCEIARF